MNSASSRIHPVFLQFPCALDARMFTSGDHDFEPPASLSCASAVPGTHVN